MRSNKKNIKKLRPNFVFDLTKNCVNFLSEIDWIMKLAYNIQYVCSFPINIFIYLFPRH
jgi:hypothetical protein